MTARVTSPSSSSRFLLLQTGTCSVSVPEVMENRPLQIASTGSAAAGDGKRQAARILARSIAFMSFVPLQCVSGSDPGLCTWYRSVDHPSELQSLLLLSFSFFFFFNY